MTEPKTFAEVVELWPTAVELANDLDVKEVTVRAWKARGIPAEYWKAIESAAMKRGLSISVDSLSIIAARDAGRLPDRTTSRRPTESAR